MAEKEGAVASAATAATAGSAGCAGVRLVESARIRAEFQSSRSVRRVYPASSRDEVLMTPRSASSLTRRAKKKGVGPRLTRHEAAKMRGGGLPCQALKGAGSTRHRVAVSSQLVRQLQRLAHHVTYNTCRLVLLDLVHEPVGQLRRV